jgi:hypothetical protein
MKPDIHLGLWFVESEIDFLGHARRPEKDSLQEFTNLLHGAHGYQVSAGAHELPPGTRKIKSRPDDACRHGKDVLG